MSSILDHAISQIDPSWSDFFHNRREALDNIFSRIEDAEISPPVELIFRAFSQPIDSFRVVIFGQDPYPGVDVADGLAFSSKAGNPIPASLRNVFKEYESDLGFPAPRSPDLSQWHLNGVLLLNRTLTTLVGSRNAHVKSGWTAFTWEVAQLLGQRNLIAILWGSYAKELAPLFPRRIESSHPSPLSARRGFFGSKPFSTVNSILLDSGEKAIDWRL